MRTRFGRFILNSPFRIAMPIGVNAGLEITGSTVLEALTDPEKQAAAVTALHKRFDTPVLLTAMDLSVEAEAFGCQVRISGDEIPTVIGRKVTSQTEIDQLPIPSINDGRCSVHLQTAQRLVETGIGAPVLGGVIGPFSLAGRLFGVSEALELSLTDPELMQMLLKKVTQFLIEYILAFRSRGAAGVIMAEPAAGLLSPRGLFKYSSAYIRQIIEATQTEEFTLILHNCGARFVHLPAILESGAEIFHFGAPMDIAQALCEVNRDIILAGNLDPTGVFLSGTTDEVETQTNRLMEISRGHKNFITSSGCDIPPHSPVENLEAFYKVVREHKN